MLCIFIKKIFFTIIEYEKRVSILTLKNDFSASDYRILEHSWPRVFRANLTTWGACGRTSRRALIPVRISTLEVTGFGTEIKRELFSFLFSRLLSFSFWIFGFKNPANSWFFLSGIFGFSLKNNVSNFDEWSLLFISKGWPAINQGIKPKGLFEKRKVSGKTRSFARNERFLRKTKGFTRNERFHEKTEKSLFSLNGRPLIMRKPRCFVKAEKSREKRKDSARYERFYEKRKVSRENREVSLLIMWPAINHNTLNVWPAIRQRFGTIPKKCRFP